SQWQTFDSGTWKGITNFNNQLVALNTNQIVYRHNGSVFQQVFSLPQPGIKFVSNASHLIITCSNHVYILNFLFSALANITQIPNTQNIFTCATTMGNDVFIGTQNEGLFQSELSNLNAFESLSPNGPLQNNIFRLEKTHAYLWAIYGGYDRTYDPNLKQTSISKFSKNTGWEFIPFQNLLGATSLGNIVANPKNQNEIYVASYHNGLLKINNNNITLFNQSNTGSDGFQNQQLVTPTYVSVRINGPAFDKEGNMWVTNGLTSKPLKVQRTNGQWQSYDFSTLLPNATSEQFAPLVIDKNNTKWLPGYGTNGLIGFNEKLNNKIIILGLDQNIPSLDVRCVVVDNRNQLWIGTFRGLRTLSVERFLSETELTANAIIIEEDGLAQELFFEQSILDIAVDGANNKWVSLAGAGVFQVSSNGQQTLNRFTVANSPLPSNNIQDIEIDDATGEVFFATDKGLISYLGVNTKA
ncbi:MAG TPA: ABC transporter substrate-binding protein, partial [Flavobacterium sp.]|nr:ABC transporter substrate-binding protein [Flavobacterium sp.]